MAVSLAGVAMDNAAVVLNDAAKTLFTYVVQVPFLKMAFDELQIHLDISQLPALKATLAPFTLAAGTSTFASPADLIRPTEVLERAVGSTREEDWMPLFEINWDPHVSPGRDLAYWAWVGDQFYIHPSTEDRSVEVRYIKSLTPLVDENSSLQLQRVQVFMTYRIAELLARFIMQDEIRANALRADANGYLDMILRAAIRSRQSVPTKRKPFRFGWNEALRRRIT